MKKVTSPEIYLRYMSGISDLTDPYYQYAVLRHRIYATSGPQAQPVGGRWTFMLMIYSAFAVLMPLSMFLVHIHISITALGPVAAFLGVVLMLSQLYVCARAIERRVRYGLFLPVKQIGLSDEGIRLISHFVGATQRRFLRWEDISEIKVSNHEFLDMNGDGEYVAGKTIFSAKPKNEPCIEVRDIKGQVARLRLSSIRSIEERRVFIEMVKRFARRSADKHDIAQILRVNQIQDIAFTQLWSNALKSNNPRIASSALPYSTLLQDGRFLVKEQIGGGGQGAIYAAEMTDSAGESRAVALKEYVLPDQEHIFDRKRAIDQFEREVHLLARLDHTSIIKPIDAFVEDHRAYLVMDLVEGDTIKQAVKYAQRFSEEQTVKIALQLCNVLTHLHNAQPQVVHLDVTPDNIIIGKHGELTLVDFNTSSDGSGLRTKLIAGKQKYMSPEQFRNEVSPLCDIYALGCTMFYMLTGVEPEPLTKCVVDQHRTDISPELCRCIENATELEGATRAQSVAEIEKKLLALSSRVLV